MKKIGIRYENKYISERRVALTPAHVKELNEKYGIEFLVRSSEKRVFKDNEYEASGAKVVNDVTDADIIIGVKEMPFDIFYEGKTYIFFSHIIKGQQYNMPMLRKMIESQINLIDYERITDDKGRRIISFGKYAGLAGMINTLWSLGLRLKHKGIETPFLKIKQAYTYNSLEDAKKDISRCGMEIAEKGLPKEICLFNIGVTGYGNVSNGAQEILNLLPVIEITPEELLSQKDELPNNIIYRTIFKEKHLAERIDGSKFELQHYYKNPSMYKSSFDKYIPRLSALVNGMYWSTEYPKLITKKYLKENYNDDSKLLAIGDVTCDIDGSIESTVKGAEIENPIFVYDTNSGEITDGYEGKGLQMMTVDILPSELPRESSEYFSNSLKPFIKELVETDMSVPFEKLTLPDPLKRALILHNGKFTEDYKYIEEFLNK